MQYLTFQEYEDMGGKLSEAEFTLYEFKARKRIDRLTASRVTMHMAVVPDAVKLCILSLIKIDSGAGAEAQIDKPTVTSFNTDGYSESFGKALGAEDAEASMTKIIRSMLWGEKDDRGVPLLYRGVDV